jgi:hypothetical protein
MKKAGIAVVVLTICGIGLVISGSNIFQGEPNRETGNINDPKIEVVEAPVVQRPNSLEECYAQSEQTYQNYLDTHAQKQTNVAEQTAYNLPQEEWDKINKQRGDEHHVCAQEFVN